MKRALAETIYAHDQNGIMDIRSDYSGRGMYGEETHAIVVERESDFHKALAACWIEDREIMDNEDFKINDFNFSTDNMGSCIIFY